MRAVHHDAQAAQVERVGERALAELDVPPGRVVDAARPAELGRRPARERPLERGLDLLLDRVWKLPAVGGEELDAVIGVRIVRGADDDPRREPERPREVGDCGGRHRAAQHDVHARRREPRLERGLEHVARDPRVLPDQHRRPLVAAPAPGDDLAGREPEPKHELRRDRRLADPAPDPVGAEILAAHPLPSTAASTASASRVAATSCTRTILAPRCTASIAAATLAARRSSAGRPVMRPRLDFRDQPASTGNPSAAISPSRARRVRLCATVLPKPKPGSTTIRSRANAGRDAGRSAGGEEIPHLGDHVGVRRLRLHRPRAPLHVHQAHCRVRRRDQFERTGRGERGDVVDHRRAVRKRGAHDLWLGRVDGNRHLEIGDPLEHRQDPRKLFFRRDRRGARAARFAAHVEQVRTLLRQPPCLSDRRLRRPVPSAVVERIRGDVHHPHHERPSEGELEAAAAKDAGHSIEVLPLPRVWGRGSG